MIRTLLFLALGLVLGRAGDLSHDKFDLSITSVALKGSTLELTLKIVNQSATPVKIDLSPAVVVLKVAQDAPSLQQQNVATRPEIYKPRLVLLEPSGKSAYFTSESSRVFAPKELQPGASLELTKTVTVQPGSLLKDVGTQPYPLFLNLAYRTDPNGPCQATLSSPTYKLTVDASGMMGLVPE